MTNFVSSVKSQLLLWTGLIMSVAGALLGQSNLIAEPYNHWLSVTFIVSTAIHGYLIKHPE